MRNWKFLLTSQIARGYWFLNPDHAMAAGQDLQMLFNPNQDLSKVAVDLIEARGAYPFMASSMDEGDGSSYDEMPEGSIAIFRVSGTMLKYGTLCSYGTEEIAQAMIQAANHPNIAGALFEIDSGGGGVNSVAPLRYARELFRQNKKPFVALADIACSAAYYAISDADFIMANNAISATFGSIGVMMGWMDAKGYYEKNGIVIQNLYAPESDEKNKSFELALKGDFEAIRNEELSPLARAFQKAVTNDRGTKLLSKEDPRILKGKTYSAESSLDNGLIDGIGNRKMAIDMLFEKIEIQKFLNS